MKARHDHRRTAIFWGLTALLVGVVNAYFALHPMYRNQAGEIDANYGRLARALARSRTAHREVTLVAGNSSVAASLVTGETLPDDVVPFVTGGLPLATLVEMVAHLPADAGVTMLVVGLSYTYAEPAPSGSAMHRPHWAGDPLSRAFFGLPMLRARDESSAMVWFSLKRALHRVPLARVAAAAEVDDPIALRTADHRRDILAGVAGFRAQYAPFVGRVSPVFVAELARLRDVCAQRGIRLETFTAPIHAGVRDGLDPAVLADFRAAIAASGVHYVDLNLVFPAWDEAHFVDATHVSRIGRAEVRDHLRTWLIAEASRGAPPVW